MALRIEQPPRLTGDTAAQLRALHGYLYRMAETLNLALESESRSSTVQPPTDHTADLRRLISNTTAILRREMAALEQTLRSRDVWLREAREADRALLSAAAASAAETVVDSLGFDGRLDTLDRQAADFERYRACSEGYIRPCFLERDENGAPLWGIAVGQGLRAAETAVNGQAGAELDRAQTCAFFTADRVSFRINGAEAAYISDRRLHIPHGAVDGSLCLGGRWLLESGSGLTVKWVG